MSDIDKTKPSQVEQEYQKERAELIEKFSEGRLPSGQDFETLIARMALESQFKDFRGQFEDLLDEMAEIVKLDDEQDALVFDHSLGMEGRIGTYKGGKFKPTSGLEEHQTGDSFTIVDIAADPGPFCVEVVAHLEDGSNEMGNGSVMLHAVATRSTGRLAVSETRAPGFGLASWSTYSKWATIAGVAAFFLVAQYLFYFFQTFCDSLSGDDNPWAKFCGLTPDGKNIFVHFFELLGKMPNPHYWIFLIAVVILLISIVVFITGALIEARDRRRLRLRWDTGKGLVLDARNVRQDPSTVRYHVTRLY